MDKGTVIPVGPSDNEVLSKIKLAHGEYINEVFSTVENSIYGMTGTVPYNTASPILIEKRNSTNKSLSLKEQLKREKKSLSNMMNWHKEELKLLSLKSSSYGWKVSKWVVCRRRSVNSKKVMLNNKLSVLERWWKEENKLEACKEKKEESRKEERGKSYTSGTSRWVFFND